MDHQFRNAVFGGFHKQDVLDFLENSAKEHAQQLQELQSKLDAAEAERQRLSDLSDQQGSQLAQQSRDLEELTTAKESLSEALESGQDRERGLTQDLESTRSQLEEQRALVEQLTPDAQAYAAIKERATGVELQAHRRAQDIETTAQARAEQLKEETEQWIRGVQREYDVLRTQIEATVAHAADKLAQAGRTLDQMTELMEQRDAALEALERAYAQAPEKVPAPVPLSEE